MSNPSVKLLAESCINNTRVRIEDNLGEAIHLHYGDLRICLTVAEYKQFVEAVMDAARFLFEDEGLNWDDIDASAFDWDWVGAYKSIESIRYEKIKLNELYAIKRHFNKKDMPYIVTINKSRIFRALKGDRRDLDRFEQTNINSIDNRTRLNNVLDTIKKKGYPFDDKYIMINNYNLIYDGEHRAACLYYLYGGDYEIPVIRLTYKNALTINALQKNYRRRFIHHCVLRLLKFPGYIMRRAYSFLRNLTRRSKPALKKGETKRREQSETISFREFQDRLNRQKIKYYLLDVKLTDNEGSVISDNTVIADRVGFEYIKGCWGSGQQPSPLEQFRLLYSFEKPLFLKFKDCTITISEKLFCHSKFEPALLPDDIYVQRYAECTLVQKDGVSHASKEIQALQMLLDALLYKNFFSDDYIAFFKEHKSILSIPEFIVLLEKEFFGFAPQLLRSLENEDYQIICDEYNSFKGY